MKTWVFQFDNKDFISCGRIENNTAYFWILMLGNEDEASKYEATAHFFSSGAQEQRKKVLKAII